MKCSQDIKYDIMDKIGGDLTSRGLFQYGPTRDTLIYTGDDTKVLQALVEKINEDYKEDLAKISEDKILFLEPSDELASKYLKQYKASNEGQEENAFSLEQEERLYNINNTGPNTERFINLAPSIQEDKDEGVFQKYIGMKKRLISMLNDRLGGINKALKNPKTTVTEKTRLNNLKQTIKTRLEGDIHRGVRGLNQEIKELDDMKDIMSVGYYVEQDLTRLQSIVKSDNASDMKEAQLLIKFYDDAGTFQVGVDNPFFAQNEIFFEDENTKKLTDEYKIPPSLMNQFKEWRDRAMSYQPTLDLKERELTTNTFNADKGVQAIGKGSEFKFDDIVHTKEGLKDIDWVSAWAMDVTQAIFSESARLAQVMHTYLINSLERNTNWSRDYAKKMEEMNEKVTKRLGEIEGGKYKLKAFGIVGVNGVSYDLFLDKTATGMDTGTLVQRYSLEFINEQQKVANQFRSDFESARNAEVTDGAKALLYNGAFVKQKVWKRANTIMMNPNHIEELANEFSFLKKGSEEEITKHKQELIKLLGEKGYNEQVNIQREMLNKYLSDKQAYIDAQIIFEGVKNEGELNEASKYAIKQWDNQHNPLVGVEDFYSNNGVYMDNRKINSFMDYNNTIPRAFKVKVGTSTQGLSFEETSIPTGFYNNKFKTIEGDEILREFYNHVREGADKIRDVAPYDLQSQMVANSLPALIKSTSEFLLDNDNTTMSMISSAWRRLMESIRLSFGLVRQSEISYASKDPITGKYNYKINDQFLQGNIRAIRERETIERLAFSQASGIKDIKRFTVIPFDKLGPQTLAKLALLLNIDITTGEIEAGRTQKIRSVTGDNVEIGKIIRDYATHTVVQGQSFDLPKLMKHFTSLAMAYAGRTEALPIMEIMKKHYESIKNPKTNNILRPIFNVPEDTIASEGGRSLAVKQMEDWFQRVMLDNYGIKHWGVHGKATKEKTVEGKIQTDIPIYGKTIYSDEEKKKIKEIDRLLSRTDNEEEIAELRRIKEGLGKVRTASALVVNLLSGVRTIGLGWNIGSALTNLMEGYTSNMILASTGEYFNPEEIYYGINVARQGWTKNLTFGMRATPQSKLARVLMDRYNILMDNKNELQKATTKTNLSKLEALNPHELSSRVEYYNQVPVMVAMLRTIKIKDKNGSEESVWNAMDTEGHLKAEFRTEENINDWEKLTGDNYLAFKNKVGEAITKGHGNYDELRGMMAKSNLAGKALMMFKTWLPTQLYWRFANEQENLKTGAKIKGRYRSFTPGTAAVFGMGIGAIAFGPVGIALAGGAGYLGGKFFGVQSELGALKEMLYMTQAIFKKALGMPVNVIAGRNLIDSKGDFENWVGKKSFTELDAKNLRGNVSEIAIIMTTLALMLLVKGMFYDDDDDKDSAKRQFHNFAVNKLLQLASQATMYVNPSDLWKNTFGSIGVLTFLQNSAKEVEKLEKLAEGHDPGGQEFLHQSQKFLPGIFKNPLNLGLESQMSKQFNPSPYDTWFWSKEHRQAKVDKEQRSGRLDELKSLGYDESERRKIINIEMPTSKQLKKRGLTREEWDERNEGYILPEPKPKEKKEKEEETK